MTGTNVVYSAEWNDDLKEFAAVLKTPERARLTPEFINASKGCSNVRWIVQGKFGVWLQYFRYCQKRQGGAFLTDPLGLDRLVIELDNLVTRIPPRSWPQLERLRDEAKALAQETFLFRSGVWSAAVTPQPPAQA